MTELTGYLLITLLLLNLALGIKILSEMGGFF